MLMFLDLAGIKIKRQKFEYLEPLEYIFVPLSVQSPLEIHLEDTWSHSVQRAHGKTKVRRDGQVVGLQLFLEKVLTTYLSLSAPL